MPLVHRDRRWGEAVLALVELPDRRHVPAVDRVPLRQAAHLQGRHGREPVTDLLQIRPHDRVGNVSIVGE